MTAINKYNPIVFYDDECGFCNSAVQFILKKRKIDFYFIPLNSNTGKKILSKHNVVVELDTIYYLKDNKLYEKSSAALRITLGFKGLYPLLFGFYIIPKFLRNFFYNAVAKRRHKIRKGYCAVINKQDEKFILTDRLLS